MAKKKKEVEAKKEVVKEPRILLPFEINILRKDGDEKLLKCGDKIQEKDEVFIVAKLHYEENTNKYKFIAYKGQIFEVILNAEQEQWEFCIHKGNEYHPKTGEPVVIRKVYETFCLSEKEL